MATLSSGNAAGAAGAATGASVLPQATKAAVATMAMVSLMVFMTDEGLVENKGLRDVAPQRPSKRYQSALHHC
jgi:hypothetical protein